jgi:acyl transferase domain-containing protein/acyl-CoA thioesterase FadM
MSFYAITYPIRFEDTMAYGSHHFLTNFRFQCAVRESLLFDHLGRVYPGSRSDYDDVVMLTRDGYSRNLAPAMLGERLAVLLSFAVPTRSSFQLCIRTINEKGEPVACGFQTIVFMDRAGNFVQFPRALDEFAGLHLELGERLIEPSFAESALAGGSRLAAVFPPEVCALGKQIALQGLELGALVGTEQSIAIPAPLAGDTVLAFPGQGSFDAARLRLLCGEQDQDGSGRALLAAAEPIVQTTLGASLQRLIDAPENDIPDILAAAPDLDQFGILLTQLLLARRLQAAGIKPAALVGHSAGEIAALCTAGCFTPETAMQIVAERIRALRQYGGPAGGMLALSVPLARAQALLAEILPDRSPVHISVVNTPNQTVLSGPRASLEALLPICFERRIGAHLMANRHAFHSPLMALPARALAMGLVGLPMQPPQIPVYSPILGRFYEASDFLPIALASHLTHIVDFPKALTTLSALGMRRMIECGPGRVLVDIAKRNAIADLAPMTCAAAIADAENAPAATSIESSAEQPQAQAGNQADDAIVIVSMGCVLPGANDPAHLWRNLLDGVGGIVDLRTIDPTLESDLMGGAQTAIQADKTYTMLTGLAEDVVWRAEFPFTQEAFAGLSKAQRLLAEALRQATGGNRDATTTASSPERTLCLLGSTADGIGEYDDALFYAGVRHTLAATTLPPALNAAALAALDTLNAPAPDADPEQRSPYPALRQIVQAMLGADVSTILLDAACASSLYALNLGVQALRAHETDLAYVGGVFSAGPSTTTLFSQFGGLSATGSHAFDRLADGVVFGDGAAVLGIRRLGDAIARGEPVLAVVRATGVSSDGHSVSVNVPRSAGQIDAMQAAYRSAGIDPQSVHYVEAHATATPVGDATEFEALAAIYGGRNPSLPRIRLGSVKSLLGHTGWAAGAASMIKVIQSLAHEVLPPHHGWSAPNPRMDLAASPFDIPTVQQTWPKTPGLPRRAAINGFGFGGANAHVVLEAFDPILHRATVSPLSPLSSSSSSSSLSSTTTDAGADIVCIGFGGAFVGSGAEFTETAGPRASHVNPAAFRMPRGKLLIPDALEQMDANQFTVLAGADRALASSGIDLVRWKQRIGIVIGAAGKARRGIAANQRILSARLGRKLATALVAAGQTPTAAAAVGTALENGLKDPVPRSNAYTLVGMMPNLIAGRVANTFNLMGPNLVIDTGQRSLLAAIGVADSYLRHGISDFVLSGGVNATAPWPRAELPAGRDDVEADGAALLLLTLRKTAIENGLAILATVTREDGAMTLTAPAANAISPPATETQIAEIRSGRPHEVGGVAALAAAMHALADGGPARRLRWTDTDADVNANANANANTNTIAIQGGATARHDYYLTDPRPIDFYALTPIPVQVPVSAMSTGTPDLPRRILLITDQTGLVKKMQKSAGFAHSAIRIIAPGPAAESQMAQIGADEIDLLLVVRDLAAVAPHALLGAAPKARAVLDLAFVAAKQFSQAVEAGGMALISLHLNALPAGELHPDAALIHGMLKSLARDWPAAAIRAIASDGADLASATAALTRELKLHAKSDPANADVEIIERGGVRHAYRFTPATPQAAIGATAPLDAQSVVVLTGGARGVTAVLAEALLERYGCKLVLLGRSDPNSVPPALRALSPDAMENHETAYYRDERLRDSTRPIVELKRSFAQLKAAHETGDTIARLRKLGHVDYRIVDITDAKQVDAAMGAVVEQLGGVTLVVHGAGMQISKHLSKRRLDEFQQVIGTKLDGLRNLVGACNRLAGPDVQFHLLTSVFSAIGNDGQPDYGAVNEAIAALARTSQGTARWSALGWMGWAYVGMTRGSEYAMLGHLRGLRAVLPTEGKALFLQMLEGRLASPALSLLSEGERQFYRLPIAPQEAANPQPMPNATTREWLLNLETAPYLRDHVVNGYPTLPGAFEIEFALQAAHMLRPAHAHMAARNSRFHRFVRVPEQGLRLRAEAKVIEENADGSVIAVRLLSDFVHRSGAVLQRDVLHFEGEVLTGTSCFPLSENPIVAMDLNPSVSCADPFLAEGSPVKLDGVFACLDEIRIGPHVRRARFHIGAHQPLQALAGFRSPVLLCDALFRLLGLAPDGDVKTGTVSVPVDGGSFRLTPGLNDLALQGQTLTLTAANPRFDGDYLVSDWGQVLDAQGRIIVSIERAVAKRMGAPASVKSPALL